MSHCFLSYICTVLYPNVTVYIFLYLDPKAIKKVKDILDSYNLTFEWEVPQGHRDYYIIVYNPIDEPQSQQSQQVSCQICMTENC